MKHVTIAMLALPLALALAGCAATSTTGPTTAQKPLEEKEYRTGSRIPVRDPVSSSPTKTVDPSAAGAAPRAM
jgi:hypothetical protein